MTEDRPGKTGPRLARWGWGSFAVAAAAGTVGVLALAALYQTKPPTGRYVVEDSAETDPRAAADPLRAELARCRALPADTTDGRCAAAWEANRRRFMGESRSYPVPSELPTATPTTPAPVTQPAPNASGIVTPVHPLER